MENRIVRQFEKAFAYATKKGWDKIYVGVDVHETVLEPTWSSVKSDKFYEASKCVLQMMTEDPEICLILWSCSPVDLNREYHGFFEEHGIHFDYINENPEVKSTHYADFETKLYFNVGLDDKFGFEPESDWPVLMDYMTARMSHD